MRRTDFLKYLALLPVTAVAMNLKQLANFADTLPGSDRMPALFIGHGSPMNALQDNAFTQTLRAWGQRLARPKAILVVSAHWETKGTFVSVNPSPGTIYDFGGFPQELSQVKYPAPGAPELARETAAVRPGGILEEARMGLDHGAWTVLVHLFPKADVPVFQLSLDYTLSPEQHFALGRELRTLRDKGILILGSGNIVHNLGIIDWNPDAPIAAWAADFDAQVKQRIDARNHQGLIRYPEIGTVAKYAVPSPDHYLPLLYTLAAAHDNEGISYAFEGFQNATISMRSLQVG